MCTTLALTVAAEGPPVGSHGAVTRKPLPQLQTHSLMVAGILRASGARTYRADSSGAVTPFYLCFDTTHMEISIVNMPTVGLIHDTAFLIITPSVVKFAALCSFFRLYYH